MTAQLKIKQTARSFVLGSYKLCTSWE